MKRFQFRLDPLLRYREYLMEQAQQEVAKVRAGVQACEEQVARYEKAYEETAHELDREISEGIDVKRYKHFTDYMAGIESDLERENHSLNELLTLLEEKQAHLSQRAIDKKVLENLKNRRREEYYKDMMKTMQKEADDTVIVRKARAVNA